MYKWFLLWMQRPANVSRCIPKLGVYAAMLRPGVMEWGKHTGHVDAEFRIDFDAAQLRLSLDGIDDCGLVLSAREIAAMKRQDCTTLAIRRVRDMMFADAPGSDSRA